MFMTRIKRRGGMYQEKDKCSCEKGVSVTSVSIIKEINGLKMQSVTIQMLNKIFINRSVALKI